MDLPIGAIELDTSIQCRAAIDTELVDDYAERMAAGDTFPPIEVFGTRMRCWIGNGWHRFLAAKKRGQTTVRARLFDGGRVQALRCALSANAIHGHRRSNADKRRCVEIALREFPKLSSRGIAKLCGVHPSTVDAARPREVPDSGTCVTPDTPRTGQDGKRYPVSPPSPPMPECESAESPVEVRSPRTSPNGNLCQPSPPPPAETPASQNESPTLGPPSMGMQFARLAIMDLEQIKADDVERRQAFSLVKEWIHDHEA